ncbi:MAG: ATPase [bacterium]|jgi:DNA repair exonuclease SbcCD ATPase subunit
MTYAATFSAFLGRLQEAGDKYRLKKDRLDRLQSEITANAEELKVCRAKIELLEQVKIVLQSTSEYARDQARQQIELLVTHALQYVFGSGIEFSIKMNILRNRPEAEFYVISKYGSLTVENRPEDARGGGVVDVISLALRIAMLHSYQPDIDGPLVLDEPAKHVSDDYIANVAEFLRYVSQVFGRQVIMVTHNQTLTDIADKAYKVEMKEGKSRVLPHTVLT